MAVDALARQVLAKNPLHPVHHYVIHVWDGDRAARAVPSAARSGQSSPGIAHMWHMAAHIFTRVKRYQDAVWQQEASARVDHAYMARDLVFPDQIHNYAHNNDWLVRNYAIVGRVRDALEMAKNLIEIPQHPRWNALERSEGKPAFTDAQAKRENSARFGRLRLLELGVRFELWDELIALARTPYLPETADAEDGIRRERAVAVALFARGRRDEGERALGRLEDFVRRRPEPRAADGDEKKAAEALKQGEAALAEVRLLAALARGRRAADAATWAALEPLGRDRRAVLRFQVGEVDRALALAREAVEASAGEVFPLALQADLLWRAGRREEAKASFRRLRDIACSLDLDLPIVRRLEPVAAALGLRGDWRPPHREAGDVAGTRPPLASLGPRLWTPPRAPDFSLPDPGGRRLSLGAYRGRPVVIVFYLGYGCLHCMEQLQLFAPAAAAFREAGIDLLAVGTDSPAGLRETLLRAGTDAALPFPLVSDETLEVFRRYRAYDDFEGVPLHGTFLVDGEGYVRWHDIGYEPFREVDFLAAEARRVLRFPVRPAPGDAAAPERPPARASAEP
jgi:peroxiredoxin